jgi:molecular chaperone GrpE
MTDKTTKVEEQAATDAGPDAAAVQGAPADVAGESQPATKASSTNSATAEDSKAKPKKPKRRSKLGQIKELQAQLGESGDKLLRLRAEFDNYRKRVQRDISNARVFGKINAVEEILPVLDHFQMAMTAVNESTNLQTLKQGMDLILAEFNRCFGALGIETIASVGERFDPTLHEAISTEFSDNVPEGHIIREWKSGHRVGDRVLRAPAVVVSDGPRTNSKPSPDGGEGVAEVADATDDTAVDDNVK